MIEDTDFEVYLYISSDKFSISAFTKSDSKTIYFREHLLNSNKTQINQQELEDFISQNIFSVEKSLNQFVKNYKGKDDPKLDPLYRDIERRYQKRYNKLFEDACEVEHRHLTSLAEALSKEFKISKEKIKAIMEGFGESTEDLYLYVNKNKYII